MKHHLPRKLRELKSMRKRRTMERSLPRHPITGNRTTGNHPRKVAHHIKRASTSLNKNSNNLLTFTNRKGWMKKIKALRTKRALRNTTLWRKGLGKKKKTWKVNISSKTISTKQRIKSQRVVLLPTYTQEIQI